MIFSHFLRWGPGLGWWRETVLCTMERLLSTTMDRISTNSRWTKTLYWDDAFKENRTKKCSGWGSCGCGEERIWSAPLFCEQRGPGGNQLELDHNLDSAFPRVLLPQMCLSGSMVSLIFMDKLHKLRSLICLIIVHLIKYSLWIGKLKK